LSSADFLNVLSKRLGRAANDFLKAEVVGEFLVLHPRAFLGSELFHDVHEIVKEYKGTYVSAGKQSHWRIPLTSLRAGFSRPSQSGVQESPTVPPVQQQAAKIPYVCQNCQADESQIQLCRVRDYNFKIYGKLCPREQQLLQQKQKQIQIEKPAKKQVEKPKEKAEEKSEKVEEKAEFDYGQIPDGQAILVPIEDIVVDKGFLIRDGLDKATVALYKENLEQIVNESPIVVFYTPRGLLLSDGFHRLAAAKQLNWDKIPAKIKHGSVQDAFAYACMANLKHGKPLTKEERKRAICEFIKLRAHLSNVQIAKELGVNEITVRRYRKELEAAGELEPITERLGADGKVRSFASLTTPTSTDVEVDPFEEWFNSHVVCGDMFDVLPKDPLKYDLIIVDPPYGITKEEWDKQSKFELLNFTRRWLNLVIQKLKPTGRLFIFWSREHLFELKPLIDEIKYEYPLNFGGLIVWHQPNRIGKPHNQKEFKITWEPIFYFYGLEAGNLNRPDTELTGEKWTLQTDADVWTFPIPQTNFEKDKKVHPAQKPLELIKHIITVSTEPNDLILDPFAGSGTTGQAAYELGRDFKLIEKNPDYIELIRERLRKIFKESKKNGD